MGRMRFGVFIAPHHPIGEHPTLQFERDLQLIEDLDRLGYDEVWVGEHHSGGWETIGHHEMFLAAAAQRTQRIKLASGVVSLPYHHPYNVAGRAAQLDVLSRGRFILGTGPGALPSDAKTFGIDPVILRDRQDEALAAITALLRTDEPVSMTWRSELNQRVLASIQTKQRKRRLAWIASPTLGLGLAGALAVLMMTNTSPGSDPIKLASSSALEESLVATHKDSVIYGDITGVGLNPEEVVSKRSSAASYEFSEVDFGSL